MAVPKPVNEEFRLFRYAESPRRAYMLTWHPVAGYSPRRKKTLQEAGPGSCSDILTDG